jgi:hypothetical protein
VNFKDLLTIDGVSKVIIYILTGFFCGYYIPVRMFSEKNILDNFVLLVFVLGLLAALFGYVTMAFPNINLHNQSPGHSISFFGHQNAHAFLYPYAVPCGIYLYLKYEKTTTFFNKIFLLISLILMFFSLIFTFDRTGIIAAMFGVLIFLFFYSKKLFSVFLIVLPVLFLLLLNLTTEAKGASTVIGRAQLLFTGLETIKSSNTGFLWGFGTISNVKLFEEVKQSLMFFEVHNNPHNVYILSILQFGVIASFFMFAYVFINILKSLYKLIRNKLDLTQVLCVSVSTSVLVHGLLEDLILIGEWYMLHFFLIFFGLLLLYNKYDKNKVNSMTANAF